MHQLTDPGVPPIVFTTFGFPAISALAGCIRARQELDRFSPITVIAPSHVSALHLRRTLVDRSAENAAGLLNVQFLGLSQFIETLALPHMNEGKAALTAGQESLAAKITLKSVAPALVAQPNSIKAFQLAIKTIRANGGAGVLDSSDSGFPLQASYQRFRDLIEPHFTDAEDLTDLAEKAVQLGSPQLERFGHTLLFLPESLSPRAARLFKLLLEQSRVTVMVALTGEVCDSGIVPLLRSLGCHETVPTLHPVRPSHARCVLGIDPADEVRSAVRTMFRLVEAGTALARIALVAPKEPLYRILIQSALQSESTAIGMEWPWYGRSSRKWKQTHAGRLLQGFLRLAGLREDLPAIAEWIASFPAYFGSDTEPSELEKALNSGHKSGMEPVSGLLTRIQQTLQPPNEPSWDSWSAWARGAFQFLDKKALDETERLRLDELMNRLATLELMGRICPVPTFWDFEQVVTEILNSPLPNERRFGSGVFVGTLGETVGLDFDHVFILGMTEADLPGAESANPLLPSSLIDRYLEFRPRRNYLAARACAPSVVFSTCQNNRSARRATLPSVWFLEEASLLNGGEPLYSQHLPQIRGATWLSDVPSLDTLAAAPLTAVELNIAEARYPERSSPLWHDPVFLAGAKVIDARSSAEFTKADGWVGRTNWLDHHPQVSPTTLERFSECPFKFFLSHVLDIGEKEPEPDEFEVSRLKNGTLVHSVLARYGELMIAEPDIGLSECQLKVAGIVEQVLSEGFRGTELSIPVRIHLEKLRKQFEEFVMEDHSFRQKSGCVTKGVELPFNFKLPLPPTDDPQVDQVAFRGLIDRVDEDAQGNQIVIDFKTGKLDTYSALNKEPLFSAGQHLQVALYCAVLRAKTGKSVTGRYWFFGDNFKTIQLVDTPEAQERFLDVATAVLMGIRNGTFIARTGGLHHGGFKNCRYCDYEVVCAAKSARFRQFEAKSQSGELAPLRIVWEGQT